MRGPRPTSVRVCAAAVAACAALAAPASASGTDWLGLRALNIAHQGGEDEAPSNTMYAYERALRLGADMLEVDVHTTADGRLVVLHDAAVDRTTNGTGRVYDLTLAQVQALDAGYNLVPGEGTEPGLAPSQYPYRGVRTKDRRPPPGFKPRDFRIPTLDEVMAAYPKVPINIEIKGAADSDVDSFIRNAEALAAFLNRLGRTDGVIVASFNDAALHRFHELAPQIDLAPATGAVAGYVLGGVRPPEGTKAFQVPVEFSGVTVVDEPFVDRAHGDGYAVHVWTINEEELMRQLLSWDVDGIMSAEPIRLERVLCATDAPRPERPQAVPGRHCNPKTSIACEARAERATRRGSRLLVELRRSDTFAGRCAGKVVVRPRGASGRAIGRFAFGDQPPPERPARRVIDVRIPRKLRTSLISGAAAKLTIHPFSAFVHRQRLSLR
jgi:glycerophosphoryl diester phosphodiesterase